MPCDVFRLARVAAHGIEDDRRVFRTSGTSQGAEARGEHAMRTTSTYELGALAWGRRMLWPDRERLRVIVLGPPPASAYRTRGFQLGYKPWARGDRLGDYNRNYREVDYRGIHQKAPPRGYHYVKDDNTGEIILAAIATGIIASIILN